MSEIIFAISFGLLFWFGMIFVILDMLFDVNYSSRVSFRRFKRDMRKWLHIKKVSYRFYRDFFYPVYERELDKIYQRVFDDLTYDSQTKYLEDLKNENKK